MSEVDDYYSDEQLLKVARWDIENQIDNGTFYVLGEEPQAFDDGELDGENFYTIVSLYAQYQEDEERAEKILWNMFKKEYPQYLGDEMAAESFGAEYGKRQRFGNRYVARDTKGKFVSNVSVGRSLKADRRNKSKTPARSGFGHKGDTQKGVSGGFKLPTDAKSVIGIGAVLGGLWAYLESQR